MASGKVMTPLLLRGSRALSRSTMSTILRPSLLIVSCMSVSVRLLPEAFVALMPRSIPTCEAVAPFTWIDSMPSNDSFSGLMHEPNSVTAPRAASNNNFFMPVSVRNKSGRFRPRGS